MDELLKADELAQRLKISVAAVRLWTRLGMPCLRCGRLVRFELAKVVAWLKERSEK